MRRSRLILAAVAGVSLLLNAFLGGMAVRVWMHTDGGRPASVFFALPEDLRKTLRQTMVGESGRIHTAQTDLRAARERLQILLDDDQPDLTQLQQAMSDVRLATERLQEEIHAIILEYLATHGGR